MRFFYRFGSKPIGGLHLWYNVHTECEHLGVSLAGQTAAGIQLSLNRETSRLVQAVFLIQRPHWVQSYNRHRYWGAPAAMRMWMESAGSVPEMSWAHQSGNGQVQYSIGKGQCVLGKRCIGASCAICRPAPAGVCSGSIWEADGMIAWCRMGRRRGFSGKTVSVWTGRDRRRNVHRI